MLKHKEYNSGNTSPPHCPNDKTPPVTAPLIDDGANLAASANVTPCQEKTVALTLAETSTISQEAQLALNIPVRETVMNIKMARSPNIALGLMKLLLIHPQKIRPGIATAVAKENTVPASMRLKPNSVR